jgi:hypothetical protein
MRVIINMVNVSVERRRKIKFNTPSGSRHYEAGNSIPPQMIIYETFSLFTPTGPVLRPEWSMVECCYHPAFGGTDD